MKIAFYSPHLCLRGTEVTMYDFADYNEKLLGNESIIIYNKNQHQNDISVIQKFLDRFQVFALDGPDYDWGWKPPTVELMDAVLDNEKCDAVYMQKFGHNDGIISRVCQTFVLCAAPVYEPHGIYAYVSEYLAEKMGGVAVPSMITPLPEAGDMRVELNIPKQAIVYGRTGGLDTWNLPWASEVVKQVVLNSDRYFIFQNTPIFFRHERVKYIDTSADLKYKARFINSCNAMIHARQEGESFGCACGEFSNQNKAVITWSGSKDRNHIKLLGDKGLYYNDSQEMYDILINFSDRDNWYTGYKWYTPENIMPIFKQVFLDAV